MEELTVQIQKPIIPPLVWNKEAVEAYVNDAVEKYVGIVYTDDMIDDAKKDRAKLNALEKQLAKAFTATKDVYLAPLAELETVTKDLRQKIKKTSGEIDVQVKSYEDALKQAKKNDLYHVYTAAAGSLAVLVPFEKIFNEASTKSEDYLNSNVKAAQAALDSQLNYWNTYTANIETLKATSADDLGITEENYKALMSYVQDGSEQAAGLAASMVSAINSGNKDAVSKLANTLADVTAKQDAAAQATADWVTDYEGQLDEFQAKMEGTVDALDMSDEAGKAAKDTIAEYVQKLKDGKKDAVAAAKDVAASVALALQNSTTYTPSATPTTTVPGHAGGTTDAENVFIAGENGPELIVGKQGSTVFPTEETDRILQAISGISLDIPDRSSPESMLSGILSKAYDVVSGKNSDLSAIDAAYTGVESSVARPAAAYSSVLDSAPLNVQPAANAAVSGAQSSQNAPGETVKKIILELVGKGSVEVSGGSGSGMTANDVLELITDNIKPVLMGILKQEIFEEGQLSYEY